jgi:hypothetical protein
MDYIVGLYEEDDLQRDYHGGGGSFQMCEKFKRRTEWFLIELVKYKYRKPSFLQKRQTQLAWTGPEMMILSTRQRDHSDLGSNITVHYR